MKLSDAFANQDVEGCLELKVEILNINYGKNESLQKACKTLEDYAILVAKIREYAREMDDLSMAVHKAIQYCIDHEHLLWKPKPGETNLFTPIGTYLYGFYSVAMLS